MSSGRVGAFFDVDEALIAINSGKLWLEHEWRRQELGILAALRWRLWVLQYRLSILDVDAVLARVLKRYAGHELEMIGPIMDEWVDREVMSYVCKQGRERIDYHRSEGHLVALLSSGIDLVVRPLAARLGIYHVVCTELEEEDGVLTGRYVAPACYGRGKVTHAERFAQTHGIDLSQSYFYSDSYSDLPMFERVGQPIVVNPDPRMRRHAVAHVWRIESWSP